VISQPVTLGVAVKANSAVPPPDRLRVMVVLPPVSCPSLSKKVRPERLSRPPRFALRKILISVTPSEPSASFRLVVKASGTSSCVSEEFGPCCNGSDWLSSKNFCVSQPSSGWPSSPPSISPPSAIGTML
jgi:hypothetical protein